MRGRLSVVGLGPGPEQWVTPAARAATDAAEIILGYVAYTNRLSAKPGQIMEATDNREELQRARRALELACAGKTVAIVSGGDPGVFAMASAVFEAIETGPAEWRALDVVIEPGVTAMLAAAARIGAPLGHDFCAISLSDNLKPWTVIVQRLTLAAQAGFVIALYNPASKARPNQIAEAFACLKEHVSPETLVALVRAAGRPDEDITVTTLADAHTHLIDMRTLVIIGTDTTRAIMRPDGARPWIYTPRFVERA